MNFQTSIIFWGIMFTIPLSLVGNFQSKVYSKGNSVDVGYIVARLENNVSSETSASWSEKLPFKRGVNLTNWLQSSSVRQIQFSKFTKQDFINIKSLGCDVIRLPINLHFMTNGEPDYSIDPLFYDFLDKIIDWAEELKLHLILDNHTFNPAANTDPNIGDILIPVWSQMAQHYKGRSNYIYYEILNEPHGISDQQWNIIQQKVIDAIRKVDKKHTIIVGPAGWNSYNNLRNMPVYEDDNLIYTFHFYDPFLFTHQGATWTSPSLAPLSGVPYPYDNIRMPDCPQELRNTWVQSSFSNYKNDGTIKHVRELIDIAVAFRDQLNVPLYCGEFGVYIPNSNKQERIQWYNLVRSYLEEKGIAWTTWDYTGGFGLFNQPTGNMFDYDLNVPLVKVLGFVAPLQKEFVLTADVNGFDLYRDYVGPNIIESSGSIGGLLDYYCQDKPASGEFCIHWTGVERYSNISFRFSPAKDLSILVKNGFVLDLQVRCSQPDAQFDVRFVDTKTGKPNDHPWRMRYTINGKNAVWDGRCNHLQIPLRVFSEHGAWDGAWFNPIGEFDWSAIDRFEIVSEFSDLKGIHLYFDEICILDPNLTQKP
jgi:endoglucanase